MDRQIQDIAERFRKREVYDLNHDIKLIRSTLVSVMFLLLKKERLCHFFRI